METTPSGSASLDLETPMESAVAMQSGAAIPKTMTGLCTIWLRSMVSRQ